MLFSIKLEALVEVEGSSSTVKSTTSALVFSSVFAAKKLQSVMFSLFFSKDENIECRNIEYGFK